MAKTQFLEFDRISINTHLLFWTLDFEREKSFADFFWAKKKSNKYWKNNIQKKYNFASDVATNIFIYLCVHCAGQGGITNI